MESTHSFQHVAGKLTLARFVPLAAAMVIGLSLSRPALAAGPDDGPVKIAIANPAKIASSIQETKDLIAKMDLDRKSLQGTVTEKQNEINAMKQALSYLKPDSPQYQEQQDKLLKASIGYDAWLKETDLDLQRKQKVQIKQLFDEIQNAIAEVAQKRGINLVIADQRPEIPDNMDQIDIQNLQRIISQRTVLYSDQSRDISGEVITLLDTNYSNRTMPH